MNRRNKNQLNQLKILKYIHDYVERWGYPPSIRELSRAVNFSSTNHTRYLLEKLKKLGYVTVTPKTARGIKIEEKGKKFLRGYDRGEVERERVQPASPSTSPGHANSW